MPTEHHDHIFVKPGKYVQGPPAVKYRGIFLNDEAPALSGWVRAKFGQAKLSPDPPVPAGVANMNHEFYARVFELLLRLRGKLSVARHVEQRLQRRRSGKPQAGR